MCVCVGVSPNLKAGTGSNWPDCTDGFPDMCVGV